MRGNEVPRGGGTAGRSLGGWARIRDDHELRIPIWGRGRKERERLAEIESKYYERFFLADHSTKKEKESDPCWESGAW